MTGANRWLGPCWLGPCVLLLASGQSGCAEPARLTARPWPEPTISSAPTPTPKPARAHRRGAWLWEFGKTAPSAQRSAELCEEMGVGRVFIKANNGDQGPRWATNAAKENLEPFFERDIEVFLFGYFYGDNVADAEGRTWGSLDAQADVLIARAADPRIRGVIVDAEIEFKGRHADAERLCKRLRAGLPGKMVGYTSFGWLSRHPSFPFSAFDQHCGDVFLPQVYYAFGWEGGVEKALERLAVDAAALGLRAPIWPIQSNEPHPEQAPLEDFFRRAGPDASVFYLYPEESEQTKRLRRLDWGGGSE